VIACSYEGLVVDWCLSEIGKEGKKGSGKRREESWLLIYERDLLALASQSVGGLLANA
jgi:hypothetical protein